MNRYLNKRNYLEKVAHLTLVGLVILAVSVSFANAAVTKEALTYLEDTGTGDTTSTFSYSMTNGTSGQNRQLIVAVMAGNRSDTPTLVYNGVSAGTPVLINTTGVNGFQSFFVFVFDDNELPNDTNAHTATTTFSGNTNGDGFYIREISGARQGYKASINTGSFSSTTATTHDVTITPAVSGSDIFMFFGVSEGRTVLSEPTTLDDNSDTAATLFGRARAYSRTSAGTSEETYTWTLNSGGTSKSAVIEIESSTDVTAPTISSVATSTTATTATITWTTNEAATSTVNYGLTTSYGSASSSAAFVTSHSIVLTGLTSGTTYNFNVGSQDAAGNVATSSNYTITTTSLGANEPGGFTAVVNRGFNTKASSDGDRGTGSFPDKTGGSEGWDGAEWDETNFTIVTDGTAPESASNVGKITYPVGLAAANAPALIQSQSFSGVAHNYKKLDELYVRTFIKLSPTYFTGGTSNKIYFHRTDRPTDRPEPFLALVDNSGDDTLFKLMANFQGTPDNGLGWFDASGSGLSIAKDQWYQIETYLKMNSAYGVKDGIFRAWLDGELVIERTNVEYRRDNDPMYWDQLHISPTYGGGPNPNDTEFYYLIDNAYVSGSEDTTGPVISSVASSTTNTTATITWTTDEYATSTVNYGLTTSYGSASSSPSYTTSHSITLTGLTEGTEYNFNVGSQDVGAGVVSTSTNYTFTTTSSADAVAPSVSVTAPTEGSTVTGSTVTVSADASDNVGVAGVQFKLDTNTNIGSEDTSAPYSITWNSTSVADGAHTIIAVARDAAGNYATSTAVSVTVDNTAPVRSGAGPSGEQAEGTTSVNLVVTTNEAATCKYDTSADTAYGSMSGTFSTTGSTSHSTSISGLSDGNSYTYYVRCQDGQGNANSSDTTISFSVAADATAPTFSSVSGIGGATSATVTWTTNEQASSQVIYGPTTSFGATTTEADVSPRVTSHSVALSSLASCTKYYFRVISSDATSNQATSTTSSFTTTGCDASASISDSTSSTVDRTTGGSVTVSGSGYNAALTVPTGYYSSNLTVQLHQISKSSVSSSLGIPSGKNSIPGSHAYQVTILDGVATPVTTLDEAVTVTVVYSDDDVSGVDESTLSLYRWTGSAWSELSACSVDTAANTVTCTSSSFSVIILAGTATESSTPSTTYTTPGQFTPSRKAEVRAEIASDNPSYAAMVALVNQYRTVILTAQSLGIIIPQSILDLLNAAPIQTPSNFSRDLKLGDTGEDVRTLQNFLVAQNIGPAAQALQRNGTTRYFGPLTRSALIEYQKANNISPAVGYFGPITRGFVGK